MLPDDVLLEIFDLYKEDPLSKSPSKNSLSWRWKTLTHVCRRWRHIVFASPQRLDLRVVCSSTTSVTTLLDIWPSLPITVTHFCSCPHTLDEKGVENLIAAVEHRDRTSEIRIFHVNGSALKKLAAAMNEPLPVLTNFLLWSSYDRNGPAPVLPETFLGGSAPRLRSFHLRGIPFPSFPRFIMSASHIVHLTLARIPNSGYIPPDTMVTSLATLPNLKYLHIGFKPPLFRPLQIGLPPPSALTCAVLPALVSLSFDGASEYFEDFLARTHTPLLQHLAIGFFMGRIFDTPRLHSLIVHGEWLRPLSPAWMALDCNRIRIILGQPTRIQLTIQYEEQDWQLSTLARICNQQLPFLSLVERLSICELFRGSFDLNDDMPVNSQWLELFQPFVAVQNLYVSKELVPFVIASLRELTGDRTMEVLSALKNLFLEGFEPSGSVQEAIEPFVSARQLSGCPVVVHSEKPLPHPDILSENG